MLNVLVATVLLLQPADLAPSLLPGTHEWFLQACRKVEENLEKGDFAAASKAASALPDSNITLSWEDAKVSGPNKAMFVEARDAAIKEWTQQMPELTFKVIPKKGEIKIGFEVTLPPHAGTTEPAGAVFFTSTNAADPNVEAVIALGRSDKKVPISPREVYNEVLFAIGVHLGLQQTPGVGLVSNRHDGMYTLKNRVASTNLQLVQNNLEAVSILRAAIKAKKRLAPNFPQVFTDPSGKEFSETVVQGEILRSSIAITNRGTGELLVRLVPDCGCFQVATVPPVPAGETIAVPYEVHTLDFPGKHRKRMILYSNDAQMPVKEFFVSFHAAPRFRILTNKPSDTFQVGPDGVAARVYLLVNQDKPFKVKRAGLSGKAAAVEWSEWEGEMADPQLNEPSKPRKGYAFDILFSPDIGLGRQQVTLAIETDDDSLPTLFKSFFLQRGIAITSPELFLGNIGQRPVQASTMLIRPDKPFKITKIVSDNGMINAKYEAVEEGHQYRIVVLYKGGAPAGMFNAKVTVHTDDPDQPTLEISVLATVQ